MLTTLIIVYLVLALWAIFSIFLYGSRPSRSIAWLFIVVALPVFGVFLYVLFGINRKRFKFFTLNRLSKRRLYDINNKEELIDEFQHNFKGSKYEALGKLLLESSGFPAVDGNEVELLHDGKSAFEAIFEAVKNAKSFIHLQYYIIEKGEVLDELASLLDEKLKEGVEVRIIYDAIGSYSWKNEAIFQLKKSGAKVFSILPINIKTILSTINYRNHRKLVIIDGDVAFTGGVNITDKYINADESAMGIWEDIHMKIEGPAVDHLHRIFIKDYYFASDEKLLADKKFLPHHKNEGNHLVQVVAGGPDLENSAILHQYVMMIHSAEKKIQIQNPYFIPNKNLIESLKMAALRGVEVFIMVPKQNDSIIAKYSMYSNFEELLKVGVKICVVSEHFFHSKLIIIDNCMASVGSGNFDYRSFEHNYELNVLLYDEKISQELSSNFEELCETSNHLKYESYKDRPLKDKILQGMAKIFSPLL
ncbi:cardiolipin synthase [Winogradskyella litorisediminis]|uniref:Cardiolipin synthase n=1 Tax=Winogradskyella litorisediminis TaxID=1156618 RepID=A0ABW3N380_9FLAO